MSSPNSVYDTTTKRTPPPPPPPITSGSCSFPSFFNRPPTPPTYLFSESPAGKHQRPGLPLKKKEKYPKKGYAPSKLTRPLRFTKAVISPLPDNKQHTQQVFTSTGWTTNLGKVLHSTVKKHNKIATPLQTAQVQSSSWSRLPILPRLHPCKTMETRGSYYRMSLPGQSHLPRKIARSSLDQRRHFSANYSSSACYSRNNPSESWKNTSAAY